MDSDTKKPLAEMTIRSDEPMSPVASDFRPPRVLFDGLDGLALNCIPAVIRAGSEKILVDQVTALAAEGGRGAAMKRMLSREVALARASLRFREALAHVELEKVGRGRGDIERVEFLEKMLMSAHKRLMSVVDRLARLDASPAPRVRISAHQAAIHVGGGAQ